MIQTANNKSDNLDNKFTSIIITNSSNFLPSDLAIKAYSYCLPVNLKETCFGLVITGFKNDVEFICKNLQKLDINHIFFKNRGFPAGDKRRCRSRRNGGSRPGFYTLYEEIKTLPYISVALLNYTKNKERSFNTKDVYIQNKIEPNLLYKYILKLTKNKKLK